MAKWMLGDVLEKAIHSAKELGSQFAPPNMVVVSRLEKVGLRVAAKMQDHGRWP
jgi:hypothetical protein